MDRTSRSSPVLVGRDDLLALGDRRVTAVGDGTGHLLFLAGEAGIGKTRLLGALVRAAERRGLRSVASAAFPHDLEVPAAPFLDLAQRLGRASDAGWVTAGRSLRALLGEERASTAGDAHHRRRLLVLDTVELVAGLAADGPVVLALEDLHWADDLTLEVIARLAMLLPNLPLLVIGTYRSDELYPRVPMRQWRNRLLSQRLAEEATLARLDIEQTVALAKLLLGGPLPIPRDLAERLYRRTDGIPLHVEEILAGTDAALSDTPLPDTLADAVLQRAAALRRPARRLLSMAAVIGRSFDLDLLAAVAGSPAESVGRALVEMRDRHLVVEGDAGFYDLRHALIRDAIAAALDPAQRRQVHRRVAEAAAARPDVGSDAFLSLHYERAGMADRAFHHARLAAARTAALSSHREALDLARRALRTAPRDLPPRERAALLRTTASEESATDDNRSAASTLGAARDALIGAGDTVAAAELVPGLVAARHLLGADLEERLGLIDTELAAVERLAAEASDATVTLGTRARLLGARSAALMLNRHLDEAIADGERAGALAREAGDGATELNVAATVGSCLVFAGRMDEGWTMLEGAIESARERRREAEAARGYRMLGSSASVLVEYERADRWLREGIEFAERTEQWNHRHYMTAHLAHAEWARGRWDAAVALAEHAMADGRGGLTTTITALHVLGYVALGRGERDAAVAALDEARRHGTRMGELQRLAPALWGLAELAIVRDQPGEAIALCEEARHASAAVRDAAYLFPFLVSGTRAHLAAGDPGAAERWSADVGAALEERSIPGTLPAIAHARGLVALAGGATGRARRDLEAAHRAWLARDRWWEGAWAAVDLARCHLRANRPAEAVALLGPVAEQAAALRARPLSESIDELRRRVRARHPDEAPWAPLSAREYEVARLVAQGQTNRQIAESLGISPRTASAHVEHILGRLGASRRAEIGAWVATVEPSARPLADT